MKFFSTTLALFSALASLAQPDSLTGVVLDSKNT